MNWTEFDKTVKALRNSNHTSGSIVSFKKEYWPDADTYYYNIREESSPCHPSPLEQNFHLILFQLLSYYE